MICCCILVLFCSYPGFCIDDINNYQNVLLSFKWISPLGIIVQYKFVIKTSWDIDVKSKFKFEFNEFINQWSVCWNNFLSLYSTYYLFISMKILKPNVQYVAPKRKCIILTCKTMLGRWICPPIHQQPWPLSQKVHSLPEISQKDPCLPKSPNKVINSQNAMEVKGAKWIRQWL